MEKTKKKSKTSIDSVNFNTYVYRVLKQVHPDTGLSGTALMAMNNLVKFNIEKIMENVNRLMNRSERLTVSSREIQSAVRLTLPGELAKRAVSESTKAVTKYNQTKLDRKEKKEKLKKGKKLTPVYRSVMAGLLFPVTRIENLMIELSSSSRKSDTAAVYLTATCEYLCSEVEELAGNAARDNKRARITPRHVMLAVRNDSELYNLYRKVVFAGGVMPNIHSSILPKKTTKPKKPIKKAPKKGKRVVKKRK